MRQLKIVRVVVTAFGYRQDMVNVKFLCMRI